MDQKRKMAAFHVMLGVSVFLHQHRSDSDLTLPAVHQRPNENVFLCYLCFREKYSSFKERLRKEAGKTQSGAEILFLIVKLGLKKIYCFVVFWMLGRSCEVGLVNDAAVKRAVQHFGEVAFEDGRHCALIRLRSCSLKTDMKLETNTQIWPQHEP